MNDSYSLYYIIGVKASILCPASKGHNFVKSDVYFFWFIMYLTATGELPSV